MPYAYKESIKICAFRYVRSGSRIWVFEALRYVYSGIKGSENRWVMRIYSKMKTSPAKVIAWGYMIIILGGALLLMLPISSRAGVFTPPVDAVFTAASAACVTGLAVYDTYTYWSGFGQGVLLFLIQVGGLGFMTFAVSIFTLTKRKIGLRERVTMQESVAAPQMGGIVRMARFILVGTILFEAAGTVLLALRFCPRFGFWRGLYFAMFHAVSAFCNAGFDLMGRVDPNSSLTGYSGDPIVNITIMILIITGGLGFFVWEDVAKNRRRLKRYRLHSKLVLVTTAILIAGGALLLFLFESGGQAMEGRSLGEKVFLSLFQSISPRTAGFSTVETASLTQPSILLILCLMIVGGSAGSTAGGIKTTTFAVLFLSIFTEMKRKKSIECFMRRVDDAAVRRSCSVLIIYLLLFLAGAGAISAFDGVDLTSALFESASALSTVGLSLGITDSLSDGSLLTLTLLMYSGRVGSLSLVFAFSHMPEAVPSQMPLEKVTIG